MLSFRTPLHLIPALVALSLTACADDVVGVDTDDDASTSTGDVPTTMPPTTTPPTTDPMTTTGSETTDDSADATTGTDSDDTTTDDSDDTTTGPDTDDTDGTTGEPEAVAEIRVLHLSPDAPNVDVYVNGDGTPAIVDLAFELGTAYIELPPDTYTFDVAPTGTSIDDSVLTVADLQLDEDMRYSAVAYDFVDNITALALVDDEADIDAGETRLQISHTAAGVPEVDLYDLGSQLAVVEDLGFGTTQTIDVPNGELRIGLDVNNDAAPDLLYVVPDLGGGINVNVYAVNDGVVAPYLIAHLPNGDTARIDPTPFPGVRVVHLSPDAPNVDVYFNGGGAFLTDVPFTAGSGYFTVLPGTFSFDVAPAGTTIADSVLNFDLTFDPNVNYTAAAIDVVDNITALALVDDVEGLAAGDTRFQIVHAGPGVPEVDILNDDGGAELVGDLAFGSSETIDVPSAAYRLGVDTNNDAVADLLFDVPELGGGVQVNVYATNDTDGNVFLLAHLPNGAVVRIDPVAAGIRIMHLSSDAPSVDVYVNGGATPLLTDIPFAAGTGYVDVAPGTYSFDIAPAGTTIGDSVLNIPALEIEAGTRYTAAAIDTVSNITALPLVDAVAPIPAGDTRLQVVHGGDSVGEIDIINLADNSALLSDISLGDSGVLDVPTGAYELGVDTNNDGTPELTFNVPELGAGVFANVYATNDNEGNVFLIVHLPDGTTVQIQPGAPVCGGEAAGSLDITDDTYNRGFGVGASCALSGSGTDVFYDVYTFTADAGDDVLASTCNAASFDTTVMVYQAPDGSANPFNPADACANTIAYNDDTAGCGGNTSQVQTGALLAGEYQVVVSTFGNNQSGGYTLSLTCE